MSGWGILGGAQTPALVTRFRDVWSQPRNPADVHRTWAESADQGFAAWMFNRSVFQATLDFPAGSTPPASPAGELAEMFANGRLAWVGTPLSGFRWQIDGAHDYYHQDTIMGQLQGRTEWWPITAGDSVDTPGVDDFEPSGVPMEYYLEQLQVGEESTGAIVPDAIRGNYHLPWHPNG